MDDTIYIDLDQTHLEPGQQFSGKILWALEKPPKEVKLALSWRTEGRGTSDSKLESELNWETEATSGEEAFEFMLPASPYSFDGPLISLNWQLHLSTRKGKVEHQLPITVTPHPEPIKLSAVPDESKKKGWKFGS